MPHQDHCSALVDYYDMIYWRKRTPEPAPQQIATVGRDGDKIAQVGDLTFPVWVGKIYEQTARKSDGLLQWRLIGTYGKTRSGFVPSAKFIRELSDAAAALGLRFELGITQFQPVGVTQ